MNIEEKMMPIDEWNKQFKCKYMQQPISFLTEENLDRLQQHCEKTIQYENGRILEEHQVTLELIIRYKELEEELEKEKEKNKKIENDLKDITKKYMEAESVKFWYNYIHKDKIRKMLQELEDRRNKQPVIGYWSKKAMLEKLLKEE